MMLKCNLVLLGHKTLQVGESETGRIRFRRPRFQTQKSVSFSALTEFCGESSLSSSQPLFVCQSELTEFVGELTEFASELSELSSESVLSKHYSASFLEKVFSCSGEKSIFNRMAG